ncbi:MAG: ABC-F family ATP-binding cassette domain-containing protein [Candidatus Cloacimonadales bacterium]|nr:ABC-F family ATP-binding cassette domain-containing protein [Candidatus Cloacimonadales bacterium]
MSIISLSNISHNFGDDDIFKNISFTLEDNSRIGLVGRNGSGKTTLFKIIIERILPKEGFVHVAKNRKIVYLTQEPELDETQTLQECVLESRLDYIDLKQKMETAENQLSEDHSEQNLEKYSQIVQKFEQIDGYNFQTEMKLVLTNLKFPENVWNQGIAKFSGGEKTRIQLAKFLLQSFDAILLDEPTNHLDLEMIYWLSNYLNRIDKPYIIISHDRHFLDTTVTKIVEIKDKTLHHYGGNYSFYREESECRAILQKKEYKNQQKKLKKMDDQIKQYRIWGRARDSEVMFKRAKELEKRREKIEEIAKPAKAKAINLNIQTNGRSGNDVYVLENLAFGFPGKTLAKNVNFRVGYQNRIAVLGRNGCGKTTLLRLFNGELKPQKGFSKKGAGLNIGYYDQMHLILDDSLTVQDTLWKLVPFETRGYVLSYLARFGFRGDDVDKKVGILSGGEKARLYLAKLIHEKPNLLILDEPTNHLDIDMINSLEEALLEYEGTIIFVSHDTYFIEKIAKQKWFFRNDTIEETVLALEELFSEKEEIIKINKSTKIKTKSQNINPIVLEKFYQKIELVNSRIEELNAAVESLEAEFHKPETYKNDKTVKKLTKEINDKKLELNFLKVELDNLEHEYLELSE